MPLTVKISLGLILLAGLLYFTLYIDTYAPFLDRGELSSSDFVRGLIRPMFFFVIPFLITTMEAYKFRVFVLLLFGYLAFFAIWHHIEEVVLVHGWVFDLEHDWLVSVHILALSAFPWLFTPSANRYFKKPQSDTANPADGK